MNPSDFTADAPGDLVRISSRSARQGWAFVPDALPPDLAFDRELAFASERAALALGNLNGSGQMLPNPTLLLRPFMSREAVASSRIEGTHVEFDQLVLMEASVGEQRTADPDLQEVSNYVQARHTGWHKPRERPFSPGFLMGLHQPIAGVCSWLYKTPW